MTGRYVVLGLLILVTMALALREFTQPKNRGEPDEWMRALVVHGGEQPYFPYTHRAGFDVDFEEQAIVVAAGRELLDDPDAGMLAAAMAYADERGHGFLVVNLRDGWDLSKHDDPPAGSTFAAIGIGDVARHGTRISFGTPQTGPFAYVHDVDIERGMIDTTAIQLALFEHPDLLALFDGEIDGALAQRSRWALDHGLGHRRRLALLQHQQQLLTELDGHWPQPLPGNLADRWEQVRAVPVRGGVLIERRPVWLNVADSVSAAWLRSEGVGELAFVPSEALASGADPVAARRPCLGVLERPPSSAEGLEPSLRVSPDGRMLVLPRVGDIVDVHRIRTDASAGASGCKLEWVRPAVSPTPTKRRAPPLPEIGNTGHLGWVLRGDQLWWSASQDHGVAHEGVTSTSQLAWSSPGVLAALGETSLLLLHVDAEGLRTGSEAPSAWLDAGALFPGVRPDDPAATVLEIHPAADDGLFIVTQACPAGRGRGRELGFDRQARRCLHRVGFREPLAEQLGTEPAYVPLELRRRDLVVRTLGSIEAHTSLAIAAEGSRVVYVGVETPGLFAVDIRDGKLGPATRVADVDRRARVEIGADGGVVVVEEPLEIGEHGTRTMARAFVLGS